MPRFLVIILVCMALLLCSSGQASPSQKKPGQAPAVIINNPEQFNRHLDDIACTMQERTLCVFRHQELINARNITERSVWYDYGNAYQAAIYPQQIAEFTFKYKDNARMLAAHCNPELTQQLSPREVKALHIAQQWVKQLVKPHMTQAEQFRALHDAIVRHGRYTREQKGNVTDLLLDRQGTCEAYSRTLWLLCRMCGLRCHIVYGHAGEPHAWNLVCINNRWYHTDATWNDPVTKGRPDINTLSHRYFMLNDKQMAKDHSWHREHLPAATTRSTDFFRKNNLYFTNDTALWTELSTAISQGHGSLEVYMRHFESDESLQARLQEAVYKNPRLLAITSWQGPHQQREGVVRFTFENAGLPRPADMKNLNLSSGVIIETRRLINSIDTEKLQKQWGQISETAESWWQWLLDWLEKIWKWILMQWDKCYSSISVALGCA